MGYPCSPRFSSVAGLSSTHVSGRFRCAQEPHDTCCLHRGVVHPVCSDEMVPAYGWNAEAERDVQHRRNSISRGFCVRCDRVFPATLDMIDNLSGTALRTLYLGTLYLVPSGQPHHHVAVALLLSVLGAGAGACACACCIFMLHMYVHTEGCRSWSWWCRRIAAKINTRGPSFLDRWTDEANLFKHAEWAPSGPRSPSPTCSAREANGCGQVAHPETAAQQFPLVNTRQPSTPT
jgi:hypothetical protein